jgi:hypothetical protein
MEKIIRVALIICAFLCISQAKAAVSPLGIAIIPPLQFPGGESSVAGLNVSALWGEHRHVYGLSFGVLGNISEQDFGGLAISGLFNRNLGMTTIVGLQAAAITNINTQKTSVVGLQIALVNSNTATSSVVGFEIGPIANLSPHTSIYGFQLGIFNQAEEVYGFQIGLINHVTMMHGLQIGLLNFNDKGLFSVCPILNFGF